MATIPTFTTVRAGVDKLTAALWNGQIVTALNFLLGQGAGSKDYCTVRQTIGQSVPTTTPAPYSVLNFDTEDTDHANGFSLGTPSRYYAQTNGNFRASGSVGFAASTSGTRQVLARVTHTDASVTYYYAASGPPAPAFETVMPISVDFPMTIGDYVELIPWHTATGALSTFVGNSQRPGSRVTFEWVSVY